MCNGTAPRWVQRGKIAWKRLLTRVFGVADVVTGAAFFKRLAVILVEDVWLDASVDGVGAAPEQTLAALLGVALATQRIPSYFPSERTTIHAVRLAATAVASRAVLDRGGSVTNSGAGLGAGAGSIAAPPPPARSRHTCTAAGKAALAHTARLLTILKSFSGDLKMMNRVALLAKRDGFLPVLTARPEMARPASMPAWHLVDQHNMRGIGHLLPSSVCGDRAGGNIGGFKGRFQAVFANVTGINSRYDTTIGFEKRVLVRAVRYAQKYMLRLALKLDPLPLPLDPDGKQFEGNLPLDPGATPPPPPPSGCSSTQVRLSAALSCTGAVSRCYDRTTRILFTLKRCHTGGPMPPLTGARARGWHHLLVLRV